MFEHEIRRYDRTVAEYQKLIVEPMGKEQYRERNEVLFSCHSCGIEGSSFTVDDTRDLFEQGLGYYPVGKTLLECQEMTDHFAAYEWMHEHLDHAFDVELLKAVNRLLPSIRFLIKFLMLYPASSPPLTWQPEIPSLASMRSSSHKCQDSWSQQPEPWKHKRFIR